MSKTGRNNTEMLSEQAILAWVAALLDNEKNALQTSSSLCEWICLSKLFPQLQVDATTFLWQRFIEKNLSSPPYFSSLILGGILSDLPWSVTLSIKQHEFAQRLVDHHIDLAQQLDMNETGLLHWPDPNGNSLYLPGVQAAWIWSATELLKLADVNTGDLPQWQEVYVYETDLQLWDNIQGCYCVKDSNASLTESLLVSNVLALFSGIPDQERAEKVLFWLKTYAPPWQKPDTLMPEWLGATSYVLFLALEHYEMTEEAQELKEYVHKYLTFLPDDEAGICLRSLWQ